MKKILFVCLLVMLVSLSQTQAQKVVRLGIIGLDTSHSTAFMNLLNKKDKAPEYEGFQVVAAYPYGSRTIESSIKRIPEYIKVARENGVEITESIAELLDKVDYVFLETNDGTMHLQQALEVFRAGKPVFIDKPVAASLEEAIAIFKLSKKYNVPCFTSSALRFVPLTQDLRAGKKGKVIGADCYSPSMNEPSHADFFWYGIHGVEELFTVMGTGCSKVSCVSSDSSDVVTGLWKDGRIGTFRGIVKGPHGYGGTAICEKEISAVGGYAGYEGLLKAVLEFFRTQETPVSEQETLEIFTFMAAASVSKKHEGKLVSMEEVYKKAEQKANAIVKSLSDKK